MMIIMIYISQAKPILNGGKVCQLLDPSLGSNHDDDQIERMVLAATLCIRREPRLRPQISLVSMLNTTFFLFHLILFSFLYALNQFIFQSDFEGSPRRRGSD
jgi:hypothetical protein